MQLPEAQSSFVSHTASISSLLVFAHLRKPTNPQLPWPCPYLSTCFKPTVPSELTTQCIEISMQVQNGNFSKDPVTLSRRGWECAMHVVAIIRVSFARRMGMEGDSLFLGMGIRHLDGIAVPRNVTTKTCSPIAHRTFIFHNMDSLATDQPPCRLTTSRITLHVESASANVGRHVFRILRYARTGTTFFPMLALHLGLVPYRHYQTWEQGQGQEQREA